MNAALDVSTQLPLSGVRVVSIALNLPGPTCARRLADFGATVIKIEPPVQLGGDPMCIYARSYYDELHRGLDVRTLNLKDASERAAFDDLLAGADVLLTSQRESALARLQLSAEDMTVRHPLLSRVAIVGEESGEDAGHDLTYMADAGLTTPPRLPTTLIADLSGAERAVTAVFAALRLTQLNHCGQHMVVSLRGAAQAFAGPLKHGLTSDTGLLAGAYPGYNFYRARDGWIALAALEPHFVQRLNEASGSAFTVEALQHFFATRSVGGWRSWAAAHDIPLSVISDTSPNAFQIPPSPK